MSIYDEDTVMIHAASKNKDAAAEFVNWMVSPEASAKKLEIDKPYRLERVDRPVAPVGDGAAARQGHGRRRLLHVHARRSWDAARHLRKFLDGLQGVLAGAMSPEEAMEATETEAERVRGKIKT